LSYLNTFSSPEEATTFLCSRVPLPRDVWADHRTIALIDELGLAVKEETTDPPPPGHLSALVKRYRWVIRDDDLNLYDSILEGVKSSASAGFFYAAGISAPAHWGALVGVISSLFKVCRNVLLRSQQLSPDLFTVLIALKNGGPATVEELSARLAETGKNFSTSELAAMLESLKSLPMRDGTARQLAAKGYQDRWQVSGI
jgi:hypothetical protein